MPREYLTLLLLYYLMPTAILEHLLIRGMIEHHNELFESFAKNQIDNFMKEEFADLLLLQGLQSYFDEEAFIGILNIKKAVLDSLNMSPKKK